MFTETVTAKGDVKLVLRVPDGTEKQLEVKNLIVTLGKELIASRFFDNTSSAISHVALGTNGTSPVLTDVSLRSEIGRVAIDSINSGVNGSVITYSAEFGPGVATGALTEAGLFNAASAGLMVCRTTFAEFEKNSVDTLVVTWNITIL